MGEQQSGGATTSAAIDDESAGAAERAAAVAAAEMNIEFMRDIQESEDGDEPQGALSTQRRLKPVPAGPLALRPS